MRDELNVVSSATLASAGEVIEAQVKPNFRALGKRFGKDTKLWADRIAEADPDAISASFANGATFVTHGESFGPDEIIVSDAPMTGWAVARSGTDTVALDLELTHELRLLGLVRDVVRMVQEARKSAGLEVTDRIELWWRVGGSPEPAEALRTHGELLAAEVLASALHEGAPPESETDLHEVEDAELGLYVWFRRASS